MAKRLQARQNGKTGHVRKSLGVLAEWGINEVRPSPENDRLYRPVDPKDPDFRTLVESVRAEGVLEPITVTLDGWILSGHRRYAAAKLAGLTKIPVKVKPVRRCDDPDRFLVLLRESNRQRNKTLDEKLREEIVSADPEEAYAALQEHRRLAAQVNVETIELRAPKRRSAISAAKGPMLTAVLSVINALRDFWPLSDRQVHYQLLNTPPLIHASKPDSTYTNTLRSYKALCDLLTRARLAGRIPWAAIDDATRPVSIWDVFRDPQPFMRREIDGFLKGYYRDLMQSQPNHIEIVGEKLTVQSILRPVAFEYTIPLTIGRGYASLAPRYKMAQRFQRSGKEKLILLIVSDFDPDGEEIAHSFAQSMRDDFGIRQVEPIKVALTAEQVDRFNLPPMMQAKTTSTNYTRFTSKHGNNVFELEAMQPEALQEVLREAITSVLDLDALNEEIEAEKADATYLEATRRLVHTELGNTLSRGAND